MVKQFGYKTRKEVKFNQDYQGVSFKGFLKEDSFCSLIEETSNRKLQMKEKEKEKEKEKKEEKEVKEKTN